MGGEGGEQDEKRENKEVFWPVYKLKENNTKWVLTGKSPIHDRHYLRPKSFFCFEPLDGYRNDNSNFNKFMLIYNQIISFSKLQIY